jgi:hypothetical protein
MMTFLSESIRRMLGKSPGRPALRALAAPSTFRNDLNALLSAWKRAELHLVSAENDRDIPVAPVGASTFVAGQGARIYSLDVFRARGPRRPRAA